MTITYNNNPPPCISFCNTYTPATLSHVSSHMIWLGVILVSALGAWLGLWISRKLKILDKPHLYADVAKTRGPVPTIQGVVLFVLLCLNIALFFPESIGSPLVLWFLAGIAVLVVIGSLDDVFFGRNIPALVRVLIQFLVSLGVVWAGDLAIESLSFGAFTLELSGVLGTLGSVARFMLCINAVNFFDGINGQASGVSTIGFVTVVGLIQFVVFPMYTDMSPENTTTLEIVRNLGGVFAVLAIIYSIVEWKPSGLIRDAGTLVFGFALAYLSLVGGAKVGTVLVVLSLVIFDAIWVTLHRLFFLKKNPLKGDYNHLHHRLLRLGRSKKEIVIVVWSWSIIMMILILIQGANQLNKVIIFILMAVVFFGVNAYLFWIKKLPCGLGMPIREEKKNSD